MKINEAYIVVDKGRVIGAFTTQREAQDLCEIVQRNQKRFDEEFLSKYKEIPLQSLVMVELTSGTVSHPRPVSAQAKARK